MNYLSRIINYVNPLEHLGDRNYSYFFPLVTMTLTTTFLEVYAYQIANDPLIVSSVAIVLYIGFIIYFSFRSGIRGGMMAVFLRPFIIYL